VKPTAELSFSQPNRREFVLAGAGLTAAGLAAMAAANKAWAFAAGDAAAAGKSLIAPGQTILFQGDSITDAGRKRDDNAFNSPPALGRGYAWLAAARLLVDHADDSLKIYNRGISGNKVYQLAERWQADCLDLKPDVLSILIGVNDFWHKVKHNYEGTLKTYDTDYRALLKRTKEALPNIKLILCEPFLLKAGTVEDTWFPEFEGYRAAAKKIAADNGAVFVPFQTMFDAAVKVAPPELWAADGVHPSCDGGAFMAQAWLKAAGA
jgi:lysophospholipase L1-like esterase